MSGDVMAFVLGSIEIGRRVKVSSMTVVIWSSDCSDFLKLSNNDRRYLNEACQIDHCVGKVKGLGNGILGQCYSDSGKVVRSEVSIDDCVSGDSEKGVESKSGDYARDGEY